MSLYYSVVNNEDNWWNEEDNAREGWKLSNPSGTGGAGRERGVYSTSWKYSIYFVYIFRTGWNFLIKSCSSDSSFNRNFLRSLYLKFKTSAHAHIVIAYYYALFTNFFTWYEFLKLSLVYILINEVGQLFYQLAHVTFLKIYSNL